MRNGLTAEIGAICKVSDIEGQWRIQTLGEVPAKGFCASGFIDAVAMLLNAGLLKPSGRFFEKNCKAYHMEPGNPHSAIFAGDIDIFQRAKASFAAAMMQLLNYAGLSIEDLGVLWICGSFGQYLDLNSAVRVGLLPPVDSTKVTRLADASLVGSEKILVDPDADKAATAILDRIKVVNLGGVLEYENRFIDHLRLQAIEDPEPN